MEQIRFNPAGGNVRVSVTIKGARAWRYTYFIENGRIDNDSTTGNTTSHDLGTAQSLIADTHTWAVILVNQGNTALNCDVELAWSQDGNDLHRWVRGATLASGDVKKEAGEILLLSQ